MSKSIETLKSDLLDRSPAPVVVGDVSIKTGDICVVYCNFAFLDVIGTTAENATGLSFETFLDADSFAQLRQISHAPNQCEQDRVLNNLVILGGDGTAQMRGAAMNVTGHVSTAGHLVTLTWDLQTETSSSAAKPDNCHHTAPPITAPSRFEAAMDAFPDPFVIYDVNLNLVSWNAAYALSMTDCPTDLQKGMPIRDVLAIGVANGRIPEAVGREQEWIEETASPDAMSNKTLDIELWDDIHHRLFRYRTENGDYVVIRLNSTELVRQKRTAEEAKLRLISALNAYPSPFVIYDSADCLVAWNDAYRASMSGENDPIMVGMHRTEVARIAIRAGKFADAIGREEEWMSDEHQQKTVETPIQDIELTGDIHHRLLRSRAENGDLVIVRLDTTELVRQRRSVEQHAAQLERANLEISHQAEHDDLTGLGNRRLFKRKLQEFAAKRQVSGGEIAVLHIDLDRFKLINDTMGHAAGDQVLLDVASRIRSRATSEEVVTRIGGDEFVVLILVGDDQDRPKDLSKQLLADFTRPAHFEGKECRFGASIGLATTPVTGIDDLLANSDLALYRAKNMGRGRLGIFDQSDFEMARNQKTLADEVLRGIENQEFIPYFQPQIDAKTGVVIGLEALARWQHPERGTLAPDAFLQVAMDLDVIADIDKMIFERAVVDCTARFAHIGAYPTLSFNVSASRVHDHDPTELRLMQQMYPGNIGFELLETIFLEEEDEAFLFKVDQYREMGFTIEVDDFGSGRASVVALQRINPDRLKIDRRLVAPITQTQSGLRLLKSIVDIGHALNIGVTAEGVETQKQADLLTKVGCDRLQGFHIARPMPVEQVTQFLIDQPRRGRVGGKPA
ncbi:putative bifunctional diguanylate cyclase/phosphodiesterase [Aestuariibius sp. HNIBRBA575]|uniref:putative bifunctional diguanylate cyclase/phosphodiesterase n=1 Tax=Aestuariibius sp. HNIBRBA575 TaxID=3233343 RepID=UPI0034A3C621